MTTAQETALCSLAEAKFPTRLHASTARCLERSKLVRKCECPAGYIITESGKRFLARRAQEAQQREIEADFPADRQERLKLALLWIEFTGRMQFVHMHARPVLMALLMDREPIGNGKPKSEAFIRAEADAALQVVDDYLSAVADSIQTGASDISVEFAVGAGQPVEAMRRRSAAVEAASAENGTIDLASFRKRRVGAA